MWWLQKSICDWSSRFSVLFAALVLLVPTNSWGGATPNQVTIFDPNPKHPWNRLYETLFIRTGQGGVKYGLDELDPLFWRRTEHLMTNDSHTIALAALDEFIDKHGENLIRDPLKRALLQRDLWALFDWTTFPSTREVTLPARRELERRLAVIIRRIALTPEEIAALPDNYAQAETNGSLSNLPRGLFGKGPWIPIGVNGGSPLATAHVTDFGGRSVFLVMLRLPEGRAAGLSYLEQLRTFAQPTIATNLLQPTFVPSETPGILQEGPGVMREVRVWNVNLPQFPTNTEWALVRRTVLVDTSGRLQPTRLIESIQVRRYVRIPEIKPNMLAEGFSSLAGSSTVGQEFFEFVMSTRQGGRLRAVEEGEKGFTTLRLQSNGFDPFERQNSARPDPRADVLRDCTTCHQPPGILSVFSYNRVLRPLEGVPFGKPAELWELGVEREDLVTIDRKKQQFDWGLLQGLWLQAK